MLNGSRSLAVGAESICLVFAPSRHSTPCFMISVFSTFSWNLLPRNRWQEPVYRPAAGARLVPSSTAQTFTGLGVGRGATASMKPDLNEVANYGHNFPRNVYT
jgi:hypothetical protein